jgi:23S rRNA pseudouridine1911/1915/1917 synthase
MPEDAILRVFRVPAECAGMRLDVFIQSQLRNTSRTRARAIVERGAYSFEGKRLRPNDRVRAEDRVALWRPQFEEPEDVPLPVIYEDEGLLVINKPPLVTVHPTARHHRNTLIKRLEAERPGQFLALIHRLDRETSGILLVARTLEAERAFKRLLEDRSHEAAQGTDRSKPKVQKTYLAICHGLPASGLIDAPLEPDDKSPLRVKMRLAPAGQGLPARTGVRVLETRAGHALVACELFTGRQHQIRVHLASVGCPVVGDKLYGPDENLLARAADGKLSAEDLEQLALPRHALHAHSYAFEHPLSGRALTFEAPLPEDLRTFWDALPR